MQAVDSSETSALSTRLKRLSAIRPTISNCNCETPQIRPIGRLTAKYPKLLWFRKAVHQSCAHQRHALRRTSLF